MSAFRFALIVSGSVVFVLNLAGCPQDGAALDTDGATPAGNSNTNNNTSGATKLAPSAPILFVADGINGVMSFRNPATLDGDVPPTTHITGTHGFALWLDTPVQLSVDKFGDLIALTSDDGISIIDDAESARGQLTPVRDVFGNATELSLVASVNTGLFVDRGADRLFACNHKGIMIWDDFSGRALDGDVPPTRMITSPDLFDPEALALAPNGDLYVSVSDRIVVFANAASRSGAIRADRSIEVLAEWAVVQGTTVTPRTICLDTAGRLYVVESEPGFIYVIDNVAARSGVIPPDRTIDFDFDPTSDSIFAKDFFPNAIAVDSKGNGYVSDFQHDAIRIIPNIGTRSGTLPEEGTLAGFNSRIAQVNGLFIWE